MLDHLIASGVPLENINTQNSSHAHGQQPPNRNMRDNSSPEQALLR